MGHLLSPSISLMYGVSSILLLSFCSLVSPSYLRDHNTCGKPICHAPQNLKFSPDLLYTYQYEAQINTVFDVQPNNASTLFIRASVQLEFFTSCHGSLQVSEVTMRNESILDDEDTTQYLNTFSEHILRFYYEDGLVQELCPDKGEPAWVLNFKKGILSAFQNTMFRLDLDHNVLETDINGACLTDYRLEEINGTTLIISKQKDLKTCTQRHQLLSIIPTASHVFQTKYHKWSPMVSNLTCRQYVDHHIISEVECSERHSFLPFYNQSLGASTSTNFHISLIAEEEVYRRESTYSPKPVFRRTSLLFDTRSSSQESSGSLQQSLSLVQSLCDLNTEELQPEFSEVFNKFIHVARYLQYEGVSELYNKSAILCASSKQHVMDGLPHLRSSASIMVMKDIMMAENLTVPTTSQFLFAMSLFNRPEAETIRAVAPLVVDRPPHVQTYLAVAALIHSYCELQPTCDTNPHVQSIASHLELSIQQTVFPESQLHLTIGALKALGNAGVQTPTLITSLHKIIVRKDLPLELRVAAIGAHRRLPCGIIQNFLLNIYKNQTNEEEIRINAYLEVVKCPSHKTLRDIRDMLSREVNNQVGSFVWSHLHNLKVSAMPSQMELQAMLQNSEFSSKFNKPYLKFSRNYESSFYINEYGVGGFVVTNVVFSHKSYIPRSISSNITVIIFGEAVNIAEVTLDIEGFEQYAEALFWNNGILSKFEKSMNVLRFLRSSQSTMRSKIDALPNVIVESFSVPKASLSVRIFGNEMQYSRITKKEDINSLMDNLNPVKIVKDFLSGQEMKIEKSMVVCDARYVTPLAVGLPLNTDAVITSTVKLDMAAFINATAFTANGQFNLDGKLKPSVAVNMVGSMAVYAYYKRTEVKVVSKMYTSTAIAGSLKLKGYKFAWLSLNLPLKKSEIFIGNNQLVMMRGTEEVPLDGLTVGRVATNICSWPLLDDALGLTFCVSSLLPDSSLVLDSPMVIFNGPLNVEVTLDKSDPSTRVYTLEYKMTELEDKQVLSVVFDTPGSSVKRGLTAALNLDKDGPNVTLLFQTTHTKLQAQGFYRNTPEEIALSFWLDMNGKKHIDLQVALLVKPSKNGLTYEPRLQFYINDKRIAELSGSYKWVVKNNISQCEINIDFRTNRLSTAATGYVRTNNVSLSTNLKLDYQIDNFKPEYVRLEILLGDRSSKQIAKVFGKIQLLSSAYPQINTVVHLNLQKGNGHLDCKAVIKTNPFLKDDTHKLVITTEFMYSKTHNGSKSDLLIEIKKADDDIDLKLSVTAVLAPGALSLSSIVRYSKGKEVTIVFALFIPKGNTLLIESNLRVTIPNTSDAMVVHARVHEKLPRNYDMSFAAIWFSGHNITVKGSYEDKSSFLDAIHVLKLMAQSQLFSDILLAARFHVGDKSYKTDITVTYNTVNYGLKLHHEAQNSAVMVSNAEVSFNLSTYSVANYIDMAKHQATMELHLDQYRDIHIKVSGPQSPTVLKAMMDVKWDANRDPSQKLLFTIQGSKSRHLNYQVDSAVEYPGRKLSASASLLHKDVDYTGLLKLEWSAAGAISVSSFLVLDLQKSGTVTFSTTVFTPFENWKATHIKYGLWMLEDSVRGNASVLWGHDSSAVMDVTYNSLTSDSQVGFSVTAMVNSTVKEVSPVSGHVFYTQSAQHVHALLDVESSAVHRVRLEAKGRLLRQPSLLDYCGHIKFTTPFHNLTGGQLSANFTIDANNSFYGGSIIALNDRNISSSFEGSVKTLNESKLYLTIYTPFQKYKRISGRFGFSSSKANIFAELKSTSFTLGFKTVYLFKNMQDFDFQISAVTGVNFVSNLLLVGTLNSETVDFRGGWNSVLVGLTARSHYSGWYDWEYRGSLFMPFEGFRESGAVAKFVFTDNFHLEVAAAVAKAKVGLKAVSMFRPEEDFGPSEGSYCVPGEWSVDNSSLLWRALFQLDTLYYPTASGHLHVVQYDTALYATTAKLQLNVIDLCLRDFFSFKNRLSMSNDLTVESSHPLLSEIRSKFELKGNWPVHTAIDLGLKVVTKNDTYKFDMEGQYLYQAVGSMDSEGIYSVTYRLTTPFQALDHCYLDFNLQAEKDFFSSNMTIDVVDNRINMDGTLEIDEHFFGLTTDFSFASPSFNLPFCHVSFNKDFATVEKSVSMNLKYLNKEGEAENFEIGTLWHFGGETYIKLSGNLVTPYESLDNVQASFLYSSQPVDREYNVEIFLKNSNYAQLKVSGKILVEKLHLVIESSLDQFKEIIMNGTLRRRDDKSLSLESLVSVDQTVRMEVQITSTAGVPLIMDVRMTDNRRNHQEEMKELLNLNVDLRRKRVLGAVGYDLLALIECGVLTITIGSEITSKPSDENWSFSMTSNDDRYKEAKLEITVIPGKEQIFEISVRGHTDTAPLNSDFDVVCNMWFDGRKGRMKANLSSWPLSGDSYLEWEWDNQRMNMKGLANVSYEFYNVSRDFSSLLFLSSPNASWDNTCIGADISLHKKLWWLNANVTLMVPSANNIAFTSFLLLPHNVKEVHSLVGKLHYSEDYKYINQVLKYSTVLSKLGLHTSVQMRMGNGAVDGLVFLEGGVDGAHFLRDNFTATIKELQCDVNSVFTSSFTREEITVDMHYKKPHGVNKITVDVNSPGHAVMLVASVDFETINNMHTHINCTTPISTFPHIGLLLHAKSNMKTYYRYGQLQWPNNSAMFNYTHLRTAVPEKRGSTNDGTLLVDFPLTTRHTIVLSYSYEENDNSSSGLSGLLYNDNTILQGNFSRLEEVLDLQTNDLIKIHVSNIYMPLGLNYCHTVKRDSLHPSAFFSDKKRIEIFKVEDSTFDLAGELNVDNTELDNTIGLHLTHSNRSLRLRTVFCTNNTIYSTAHVTLKPSVWASSTFYLYRKHTEKESQEEVQFVLSYPRRTLSVNGAYEWMKGGLKSHLRVEPGSDSQPVAVAVSWLAEDPSSHQVVLLLSHPSLEKNLTLTAHIKQTEQVLLDVDAELEYALLAKRKLSVSGSLISKPRPNERNYELAVAVKHPITRFHMDLRGAIEKRPGYVFSFKNFSYARSFLPLQFWNSSIKLDFNEKLIEIQRHSLRDSAYIRTKYRKQGSVHHLEGTVVKGKTVNISGTGFIDLRNTKSSATVNLTSDASEQVLVAGDYVDNRHVFFNVWRRYDDLSVSDVAFFLRLNHSRLLTANYAWRTSMKQDFVDGFHTACGYVWTYVAETAEFWTDFMKTEVSDTVNEIWFDAEPVLQEFIDDVSDVQMLKSDIVYFQQVFNESYEANEFFMQDIYNITLLLAEEIAFRDKMGDLPKIVSELWQVMGETGESVRQSILYLIETVKNMYLRAVTVCSELMQGNALQHFSQLIAKLSSKYDKMIKDLHVTFVNYVESLWTQMAVTLTDSWNRMLQVIEPAFIEFLHYVDSLFWDCSKKVIEFLYQKQSLILTSANLAKDSNFTKDLDKFYKDVTKNGFFNSFKKYTVMIVGMLKEKYFKVVPFGYELTEITSEIYNEVKELYKLPAVNFTIDATKVLYNKTVWLYGYFNVGHKIQQALPFVYSKAVDLSHTALQNEIINHERKTKFVFEPRRGELYLEQLLPMPWHSFNRVPNFEEIPEYKILTDAQKWLTPSNQTFWSLYYQYSPLADYRNWLPPYQGEAIIGRNHHFITFDKQHFSLRSPCTYLLAKDFVRNDFALVLAYSDGKHLIDLFIGPYIVEIDLHSDTVTILSHRIQVPANLNGTLVFFQFGIIVIESDMGFSVHCNVKYDVCTVKLSGWYFGKTAGLLGTLDNEPSNDLMMSSGEVSSDMSQFTSSWMLDSGSGKCASHIPAQSRPVSSNLQATCDSFFATKVSQFSSCFPIVDPLPYNHLCHKSLSDIDNDICTSAVMYIQECLTHNIPLRTPNNCVKCQLYLNSNAFMSEGDFIQLKGSSVPQSSDVVFILEAKPCNDFSTHRKSMPTLVNALYKELIDGGLTNSRFAVVVFGGDGVFDEPRNLLVNNEVFGSYKYVYQLFTQIPLGNGNADIFRALRFATKLRFRAGVSKTFVLISCSLCNNNSSSLDYSALHEVLIEKDITLHVVMNNDFGLEKVRSNRILYGVDSNTAYTKNDWKGLKGDSDLRRQVKLSKHLMGYCTPLALESNGSIFSAVKLENMNANAAKKFVGVLAKRVASSAWPSDCQNCECAADESGVDTIDCALCVYPTPTFVDFELKDNSSFFQSLEDSSDFDYNSNDNL